MYNNITMEKMRQRSHKNKSLLYNKNHITISKVGTALEGMMVSYIRYQVFIVEQNIDIDEEFDGTDADAVLFLIYFKTKAIGTCRYRIVKGAIIPGRIAIVQSARGKGYGKLMMQWLHDYLDGLYPKRVMKIHAQVYLTQFYESFGYVPIGKTFTEAGIVHQAMIRKKA